MAAPEAFVPGPAQGTWQVDGVLFSSAFDAGNLGGVARREEPGGDVVYDLRAAADCEGLWSGMDGSQCVIACVGCV
jgi:hypothetical protein